MADVGRPTKYNPEFHPGDFIKQSKNGMSLTQIAATWDVNQDTVHEWKKQHKEFSEAVKEGRTQAKAWWMNLGRLGMLDQAMVGGKKVKVNLGFYVWLTKNMFDWSDQGDPHNAEGESVSLEINVRKHGKDNN